MLCVEMIDRKRVYIRACLMVYKGIRSCKDKKRIEYPQTIAKSC